VVLAPLHEETARQIALHELRRSGAYQAAEEANLRLLLLRALPVRRVGIALLRLFLVALLAVVVRGTVAIRILGLRVRRRIRSIGVGIRARRLARGRLGRSLGLRLSVILGQHSRGREQGDTDKLLHLLFSLSGRDIQTEPAARPFENSRSSFVSAFN